MAAKDVAMSSSMTEILSMKYDNVNVHDHYDVGDDTYDNDEVNDDENVENEETKKTK